MRRNEVQAGSVIGADRGLYAHYGILMDDGEVVHYTSKTSDVSGDMEVRKTGIEHFLRGAENVWRMILPSETEMQALLTQRFDSITGAVAGSLDSSIGTALGLAGAIGRELAVGAIMKHYRVYPPEEVQRRALSRVGERKYNLVFRNCEHFAVWCATGLYASSQVEGVLRGGASLVTALLGGSLNGRLNRLLEPARREQIGGTGLLTKSRPVPARALLGSGRAGRAVARPGRAQAGESGEGTCRGGGRR